MTINKLGLLVILLSFALFSCNSQTKNSTSGAKDVKLVSEIDSVSYSIGLSVGENIKKQGLESPNYDALVRGFMDGMDDDTTFLIDKQVMNEVIQMYFQRKHAAKLDANLKVGQDFLAKNKTVKGVQTTESGLQYSIEKEGSGDKPKATDKVKVHYHGTLIDGTVFDSSVDRGEPIVFGVNRVIKGWTEALQLMSIGAKWKLFIPADLAYGQNPHPNGPIQPNMALIFDVELLEIIPDTAKTEEPKK